MMRVATHRHPEIVSRSIGIDGAELSASCSWMLKQVQHDDLHSLSHLIALPKRASRRHPELVSGSIGIDGADLSASCSWMLKQVQHDGRGTQSIAAPAVNSQMPGLQK